MVLKKSPRLQLARLRVEIGNSADHLLHLNVAKSQVIIPHELKSAFENYISVLKKEAEREYFNRGLTKFVSNDVENKAILFERQQTNKGMILSINPEFVLIKALLEELKPEHGAKVKLLIQMVNTMFGKMRSTHSDMVFIEDSNKISSLELFENIKDMQNKGISNDVLRKIIIPGLGYKLDTLPKNILELIEG